jgi:hypothetical protein
MVAMTPSLDTTSCIALLHCNVDSVLVLWKYHALCDDHYDMVMCVARGAPIQWSCAVRMLRYGCYPGWLVQVQGEIQQRVQEMQRLHAVLADLG